MGDNSYYKISQRYVEDYANRIGADYRIFLNRRFNFEGKFIGDITFEKCRLLTDDIFLEYDEVLYLDVDIIPDPEAPSIFEAVDVEYAGLDVYRWHEWDHKNPQCSSEERLHIDSMQKHFGSYGLNIPYDSDLEIYKWYNSGVMYWTRSGIEMARDSFIPLDQFKTDKTARRLNHDEIYWNVMLEAMDIPVTTLPNGWNVPWGEGCFKVDRPANVYFNHFSSTYGKQQMIDVYG